MTATAQDLPYGERRGIPIETLNYINASIDAGFESARETMMTKADFAAHDRAELQRYDTIIKNQAAEAEKQEHRYIELIRSIDSYTDKSDAFREEIKEAFVTNSSGKPDFSGHKTAHEAWIAESKARKEFWTKMGFELAKWGLIGFLGWLLIQAWSGALRGPTA